MVLRKLLRPMAKEVTGSRRMEHSEKMSKLYFYEMIFGL